MPETTELLTMDGEKLWAWYRKWSEDYPTFGSARALAALRDAIVTAARESDAAARIAAQREAASRAWDEAIASRGLTVFDGHATRNRYLDRAHPLPARECVLCDVCGEDVPQPEPDVRVTRHNIEDCVRNVRKSFAAGVGR